MTVRSHTAAVHFQPPCQMHPSDTWHGAAIRTAVVFFYLANEGLSCLENAAVIGLPVPDKLKEMLAQLKEEKSDKQNKE